MIIGPKKLLQLVKTINLVEDLAERELQEAITELKEARRLLERVSTEFAASDEMDKVRGALLAEMQTCLDRGMPKEGV